MPVTHNGALPDAKALFGLSLEELRAVVGALGLAKYRAVQLGEALYKQRVQSLEEITTLPVEVRQQLAAEGYCVGLPEIAQTAKSIDGTERYLMRMADGESVETVWMPDGDGGEQDESEDDSEVEADGYKRATICISSQVGCAVNCQFCLTARLGQRRNLTAGEIAGQVAAVLNRQRVRIGSGRGVETPSRINLVFMGMGEPFLNYDAFMQSVHVLRAMGIPESRMTVSTSGIEPAIRRFGEEAVRPRLALSLNASNDAVREQIMPVTRKWNIAALLAAVRSLPLGKREYVTFEYVLLGGLNDQPVHAREVLALLAGMKAKVNLIVWNPGPGIDYREPAAADVAIFHRMLIDGGIPTFTRRPRGRDIYAACGQLKRTVDAPAALVELS
ncbi:MAG: 23S rRNA (adenine(2503)-C(2))-methyltransferase RlmN [Acidobacteriaceae bacterium]|nr:23S rRNA (adenine(2503)-C(2))-methyltransferase RlmN [Acidobacteriaceae bacterium]